MWDSVLKLGKSLSLPLFLASGQRKEGPALHWLPWCNLPQLSVRLSSAQRLASICHLTCFLLPQLPCSLHGRGGEGGDWSGLRGEPPPAQGCSSYLEGRPRVWRTRGPFRETELFPCQSSAGLGWTLRLTGAGLQPLHAAWHSAEVGRGQNGSRWSQEGAVATGKLRPWADLTTDPGYTTALSEPQCPHGGGRESPVLAIHCVARILGSVALTLQGVQGGDS